MDTLALHRRVSTRASLAYTTVRHLLTANPSIQSSSSRPITPMAIPPATLDPANRSHLRSSNRHSPPSASMQLVTTSPSKSKTNPNPNSSSSPSSSSSTAIPSTTQVASCRDGQFSDADSDDDMIQLREKKRLKLDYYPPPSSSSTSTQPTPSYQPAPLATTSTTPTTTSTPRPASPKLPATPRPTVDHARGSAIKQLPPSGTVRKLQPEKLASQTAEKPAVITISRSAKTTPTPGVPSHPTSTTIKCDSSSQLPMATRRLAMLVGIPESSQAIIQSTLSLPSSRIKSPPGRTSHPQSNATDTYSAATSKHTEATTPLPSSHRSASSGYAKIPVDSCTSSTNIDPLINPILSASNVDCRPPGRFSSHGLIIGNQAPSNALLKTTSSSRGTVTAPRYGKTSNCAHDFTMPAPGTFSIRAPSSSQILRSFTSTNDLDLPEPSSCDLNRLEKCEEASEADLCLNNPPSTRCRAPSHDDANTTTNTAMTPTRSAVADGAPSRKRKPRGHKAKRNENGESEVELVKPPPTINGKVSHARKVPPGYVKRTPNSFLMFRSHVIANKLLPPGVENDNRQISRVVSGLWADLSEDDLRTWQEASRELRAAVRAKNPGLKHAPNQKRREVIRRRRNGQLPGETPEQRVEREKATAAALAKVIIEGRGGEQLDKGKLVELANTSMQPSVSTSSNHARETSRPEFRAPSYYLSHSTLIQGIMPLSECAESTLTHSPAPDPRRALSSVPDSRPDMLRFHQAPLTPKTAASGPSTGRSSQEGLNSTDRSPGHQPVVPANPLRSSQLNPEVQHQQEPTLLDCISPEIISQQPMMSPTSPHPKSLPLDPSSQDESSSNIFLALGATDANTQGFPNTFSNEMLRSLGLTASDLGLTFTTPEVHSTVSTSTTTHTTAPNPSFSTASDGTEQDPRIWNHETRFSNLENFRTTGTTSNTNTNTTTTITTTPGTTMAPYPFRELSMNEPMSSQDTSSSTIHEEDSCSSATLVDPLSKLDTTHPPLELSSLINDCYTEPLNCEGLNFDALYLNCTPNSLTTLDLDDPHHPHLPFPTSLFDAHLNASIDPTNSSLTLPLWDRKDPLDLH